MQVRVGPPTLQGGQCQEVDSVKSLKKGGVKKKTVFKNIDTNELRVRRLLRLVGWSGRTSRAW